MVIDGTGGVVGHRHRLTSRIPRPANSLYIAQYINGVHSEVEAGRETSSISIVDDVTWIANGGLQWRRLRPN